MQLSFKSQFLKLITYTFALFLFASSNVFAEKVTFTENEFLDNFSGKLQKVFIEKLGEPAKKQISVKPSGASGFMTRVGAGKEEKSKPVKVEMWYYKNVVKYDPKHTYKETEITFVNGKAMNIAFFNNR